MSDTDAASRTEEPTPRKLEQARERGEVAKTPDLPALASLAAVAAVIASAGGLLARKLTDGLLPFLARPDAIALRNGAAVDVARHAMVVAAPALAAVLLAAGLAGAAGNLVQTGLMFTPSKLAPDFSKVSLAQGFKRIVSIDSLAHFLKSLAKIAATSAIAWWVVKPHVASLANLAELEPAAMLPFILDILRRLVFAVIGLLVLITGADWFWQRQRFLQRMRMTKEEIKEEYKQSEGDPHVRAKQKAIRADRARRRMMQAVPNATVVIMNPTHYAVALRYEQDEDEAPVCVAKGLDSLALKIREIAEEAGVAVVEDPPLARALYAAVEVDEMIPTAHYEAVAKIIGFILGAASGATAKAS